MPRKKFIAGNWKMYTLSNQARELAAAVAKGVTSDEVDVAVIPPFPWLGIVGEAIRGSRVLLGAQDCSDAVEGAFTGQTSPKMLLDVGCKYVVIGHSERRHGLFESDELLNRKVKTALGLGLNVIFCIGELLAEREGNRTESVLHRQLSAGLDGVPLDLIPKLRIAYEPVWAIGTGRVATDHQAQEAHAFIRKEMASLFTQSVADNLIIAYGGSVKPENAAGLMAQPDVDGALVGGASLKADSFLGIVKGAHV